MGFRDECCRICGQNGHCTEREIAKTDLTVWLFTTFPKRLSVFKLRQANVEMASHLPNSYMAIMGVTDNENTENSVFVYDILHKRKIDEGTSRRWKFRLNNQLAFPKHTGFQLKKGKLQWNNFNSK